MKQAERPIDTSLLQGEALVTSLNEHFVSCAFVSVTNIRLELHSSQRNFWCFLNININTSECTVMRV